MCYLLGYCDFLHSPLAKEEAEEGVTAYTHANTHTYIWKHKLLSFLITYSGDNLNRTCANTFTFIHSLSHRCCSKWHRVHQPAHPTNHSFIYYFTSIHRNKIICINNIGCGFPLFGLLASIHLMEIVNIWANERTNEWANGTFRTSISANKSLWNRRLLFIFLLHYINVH